MRILVTGGAGFIGSQLVDRLLARGDEVVCLDDFNDYYDPAIKRANVSAHLAHPAYRLVEGDLCDSATLDAAFAGPLDAVIHLAARAGVRPSLDLPALYYRVNCEGTVGLLERCRQGGPRRVVFASSSSVYGGNTKVPFHEDDPVDRPVSPYAASKRAGELLCHTYHHLYGLDIACLRFFTVYGPRQRPEMAIHRFAQLMSEGARVPVFGAGDSSRDYTYVDDIVDGVLGALAHSRGYRIYNLGGANPVALSRLVQLVGEAMGLPVDVDAQPTQPGDVDRTFADVSRAAAELGYAPKVDIEEGVRRFVAWFRLTSSEPR